MRIANNKDCKYLANNEDCNPNSLPVSLSRSVGHQLLREVFRFFGKWFLLLLFVCLCWKRVKQMLVVTNAKRRTNLRLLEIPKRLHFWQVWHGNGGICTNHTKTSFTYFSDKGGRNTLLCGNWTNQNHLGQLCQNQNQNHLGQLCQTDVRLELVLPKVPVEVDTI